MDRCQCGQPADITTTRSGDLCAPCALALVRELKARIDAGEEEYRARRDFPGLRDGGA